MENPVKKQKRKSDLLIKILNTRGTAVEFLKRLPNITQIVICRLFPHVLKNKWWSNSIIIDSVFQHLKNQIDPALYNEEWVYTGSLVLEAILGETFDNGKKDVDVLATHNDIYGHWPEPNKMKVDGYKQSEGLTGYSYTLVKENDPNDSVDFIAYSDLENRVDTFDLACCRFYVCKKQIYISNPLSLIKKKFNVNIWRYIQNSFFPTRVSINMMYNRLDKYTDRGFQLHIVHKYKDLDKTIQEYNDKACSVAIINNNYYKELITNWFENRPKEGVYKSRNLNKKTD